jgi:nucleoside-diphosphate-sugar epimerase
LNKTKILITGGTGFIGYNLSKECLKLKWSVTSLSSKKPKNIRKLKKVKYLVCDISDEEKLKKKIKNDFDYVVNLAGYVDHTNKSKTMISHYNGCKNISSIFLNSKIKKFIQIGSSIEYGKIKSPQKENNLPKKNFLSTYGKAKFLSTKHLLKLNKTKNFPVSILRLYLVYGPYQDTNRVIPYTIINSLRNKKFNCSSGKQFRDFLYIDDLTKGIIKVLKNKKALGEIINLGFGKANQIKKIILLISKIINLGKPTFGQVKLRKDEIINLYPDINKAKKILNWVPKINIHQGLTRTINFYKKNKNFFK